MGLPEFTLERWLRAREKTARLAIGGSGVARGDVTPYLPSDMARAWATHPDEAGRMLRESVARQYGFDAREVLPTAGASEADAAAVLGLAGPGAHVVIERPAYHALLRPAEAFGCRVTRVERSGASFDLPVDELLAAIRPDTRLVVLARPNNPTGSVVPAAELRAIGDAAARVGAWVLVDEVFADATELPIVRHERLLHVGSVTKCLGFSGLRCGWVAGAPDALEAIDRAKSHLSVQNALLDLQIAARVLDDRPKLIERTRETRRRCAAALTASLRGAVALRGRTPEHGTTMLLRLPDGMDDLGLAERLAREKGIVCPPGSFVEMPGFMRAGLVGEPEALREGIRELDAMAAQDARS